jgi:hypothetical protein
MVEKRRECEVELDDGYRTAVEAVLRYDDLGNIRKRTRFWGKEHNSTYE